ncbi:hypothetical protein [Rhizobium sp.]
MTFEHGLKSAIAGFCLVMIVLSSFYHAAWSRQTQPDVLGFTVSQTRAPVQGQTGTVKASEDHSHPQLTPQPVPALILARALPRERVDDRIMPAEYHTNLERPPRMLVRPTADVQI